MGGQSPVRIESPILGNELANFGQRDGLLFAHKWRAHFVLVVKQSRHQRKFKAPLAECVQIARHNGTDTERALCFHLSAKKLSDGYAPGSGDSAVGVSGFEA